MVEVCPACGNSHGLWNYCSKCGLDLSDSSLRHFSVIDEYGRTARIVVSQAERDFEVYGHVIDEDISFFLNECMYNVDGYYYWPLLRSMVDRVAISKDL